MTRVIITLTVFAMGVAAVAAVGCGGSDEPLDRSGLERAQAEQEKQEQRARRANEELRAAESTDDAVDLPEGTEGATPSPSNNGPVDEFETYVATAAGWSAEVPAGSGWSPPVDSEPTPGQLFRTEIRGPEGLQVIVDSTPFDPPTFSGAPVDSRTTVSHPDFGPVEKIVFSGNSNIDVCETGLCVDYLIPHDEGGYAVLVGGSANLGELEELGDRIMSTLRYYDY